VSAINEITKRDFPTFLAKAFYSLHGKKLKRDPDEISYVDYLASELGRVAMGEINRVCVSLPPRHLKTKIGTALAAYALGQNPYARVMVLCYNESLARAIANDARELMTEGWYKKSFATRLASDRAGDLRTTAGGGLFASWIGGGYTGRGADLLIIDDPVEINQGSNLDVLEHVNETFDNVIRNRLNSPKDSKIIIIAHRLHECDLPGHVLGQGGWLHLCLPLIATKRRSYRLHDGRVWTREKGELLRPDVFDTKVIRDLRRTANFESLYQQNVGPAKRRKIKAKHFGTFSSEELPVGAVVLSVDPGFDSGDENSFTVVQAWIKNGTQYCLVDQWRAQADYDEVEAAIRKLRRKYQPVKILIEAAGYGLALCRHPKLRKYAKKIKPGNRSKEERLAAHSKTIRAGGILVLEDGDFRDEFIDEVVDFSTGKARYDDQVDAMTQYLDYMATDPHLEIQPRRGCAVYLREDGRSISQLQPGASNRDELDTHGRCGSLGKLQSATTSKEYPSTDAAAFVDELVQATITHPPTRYVGFGSIGYGEQSRADRLAELQQIQDRVFRRPRLL
jgi:predicted phage terminase large subunit-like protein